MSTTVVSKWGKYHENLLKRWAENAKLFSNMHTLSAQYYSKWNRRLGIPIVIIGGITASSIFSNNNSQIWIYVNGILALIVTALAGISNFLNIAEKMNKHRTASFKYTKIGMDIDTMLSFAREERKESPQEFIQHMKTDYLEIRENTPEVLSWVIANYINKLNKSITNTRSKINTSKSDKNLISYIQRSPSFDNQLIVGTDSDHSSITNRSEREITNIPNHRESGEILSDFTDSKSKQITNVNKQLHQIHSDDSGMESEVDNDNDNDKRKDKTDIENTNNTT